MARDSEVTDNDPIPLKHAAEIFGIGVATLKAERARVAQNERRSGLEGMMRLVRFHTPEMGRVGHTRWFREDEKLPELDWSRVTAIETSEEMTVDQFKAKYPDVKLPTEPK
jgi:hypothetical protein